MSDITLSKAVRSNLLNLQSTAELLGKSQERLSSGLRVNSALDNPTNFFTAQGLNSRANDLSQLSDAVSNAVQTVAAADKGISAITKLVESAQATARQALQTSATVSTTTPASAATTATGSALTGSSLVTAGGFADGETLTLSGGGFSAVSIAFEADGSGDLDTDTATINDLVAEINSQAGATIASIDNGALRITGTNTTAGITVGGSHGTSLATATVTAESTSTVANPKRAELVETYNDLLGQIDAIAKDASFNGVNLLNGVIDTLRSQSAKFGSNLSVVETRQDFTKQMINVLQTGASNLTLADTNEEAANVLALQTRQQLSSTALSLASQADQNVLRLF
jgi:flagellin